MSTNFFSDHELKQLCLEIEQLHSTNILNEDAMLRSFARSLECPTSISLRVAEELVLEEARKFVVSHIKD